MADLLLFGCKYRSLLLNALAPWALNLINTPWRYTCFLPPKKNLHCLGSLVLNFRIVLEMLCKILQKNIWLTYLPACVSFFCLEREKCPLSYSWMNLLFECIFTICRMYSEEIRMRKKVHRPKTWIFATQPTVVEQISVPVIIEASVPVVPLWSLRSQIWFRRWPAMADCITSI